MDEEKETIVAQLEASEPKWVNSVLKIIGVNSLRLEGIQLIDYDVMLNYLKINNCSNVQILT